MIEALERAAARPVSRETLALLERYVARLKLASAAQNLISASTLDSVWERHILDSAQLVRFEPRAGASWVDIGSGAGLPGIVIAALTEGHVTLVEPRISKRLTSGSVGERTAERLAELTCRQRGVDGSVDQRARVHPEAEGRDAPDR